VDWGAFDLVVVRSVWDYVPRREQFLAWAERVASVTRLANPVPVLRWSTDKRYLRDLQAAGVPVVPTVFLEPGDPVHVPPTTDVVVKPAISAGSADTDRYSPDRRDQAATHIRALLDGGRVVMLQPYLGGVDRHGETACVYFGGSYSHAFRKGAILRADGVAFVEGLYAAEDISPAWPPTRSAGWPTPRWTPYPAAASSCCTAGWTWCRGPTAGRWCSSSSWPSRACTWSSRRGRRPDSPRPSSTSSPARSLGRMARGRTTTVLVTRVADGTARRRPDEVAVEEPMEIRLDGNLVTTTMRTPGHDFELAGGLCFADGLLAGAPVSGVRYCATGSAVDTGFNVVTVETGGLAPVPRPA
jgi:hypothetical protein